MNNMMQLIIKKEKKTVSIEISKDCDIYEILEEIKGLLIAWGYHPNSVCDGITHLYSSYENEKEENKLNYKEWELDND